MFAPLVDPQQESDGRSFDLTCPFPTLLTPGHGSFHVRVETPFPLPAAYSSS